MAEIGSALLVLPDLNTNGPVMNALALAQAFAAKNIHTLTVALTSGLQAQAFADRRLPLRIEPKAGALFRGRALRAEVRAAMPDIVHALDLSVARTAERLAREARSPLVITVNRFIPDAYEGLFLSPSMAYVAVSEALRAQMISSHRVPRAMVSVIPNGIDLSHYPLTGREFAANTKRKHNPVVASLGRLAPHKGQRTLLHAAKEVLAKWPGVEFLILGDGPDLSALRHLAEELGISHRVTFADYQRLNALPLRDIDIFVEPSHVEGLGLSVMQAMAWGRPVVASGVGGLYSLVQDGETGLLVPKDNPKSLATALGELLADPGRAAEMGRRGRERIEAEFNIGRAADRHLELYAELRRAARPAAPATPEGSFS